MLTALLIVGIAVVLAIAAPRWGADTRRDCEWTACRND